jgi:hypothetical protein
MPDAPERRGDEHTSRTAESERQHRATQDQPDRPGQPGDLATRDRAGKVSPRTADQAEGERDEGA